MILPSTLFIQVEVSEDNSTESSTQSSKRNLINIYLCVVSERVKLKRSDYPLVLRVMQGPCEQVCKVFLMEEDLGEEVTYDVMEHIPAVVACHVFYIIPTTMYACF